MTGLGSTGAWVMTGEDWPHDGVLRATTLDALLGSLVRTEDHALLKLDVEGHEIEVLKGAVALLPNIELVIAEVLFYDVESSGTPVFSDVASYLRQRGLSFTISPRSRRAGAISDFAWETCCSSARTAPWRSTPSGDE